MTDPTRNQLLAAIASTPSPTRTQMHARAALNYGVASAWMLGLFCAASMAGRDTPHDGGFSIAVVAGLSCLAAALTAFVFARGSSPLGRSSSALAAACALVPCAVLSWLALWRHDVLSPDMIPFGWRCLGLTLVLGSALLWAGLNAKRHADPVRPSWHGAVLGAIAGAWAAVLVAAWCPLYDFSHACVGHVAPLLCLIAVGAIAGRRLLV